MKNKINLSLYVWITFSIVGYENYVKTENLSEKNAKKGRQTGKDSFLWRGDMMTRYPSCKKKRETWKLRPKKNVTGQNKNLSWPHFVL